LRAKEPSQSGEGGTQRKEKKKKKKNLEKERGLKSVKRRRNTCAGGES